MNLESLLAPFKEVLTGSNYDCLINVVTTEVTIRFEKVVLKSSFNRVSLISQGFSEGYKRLFWL